MHIKIKLKKKKMLEIPKKQENDKLLKKKNTTQRFDPDAL